MTATENSGSARRWRFWIFACLVPMFLCGAAQFAFSLATEEIGNKPLSEKNYERWPGIANLVNHRSRVYQFWVNGNEDFYYRGDVDSLNAFLKDSAKAKIRRPTVILKQGKAEKVTTFEGETVDYAWKLHLTGGLAAGYLAKEQEVKPEDLPVEVTIYQEEEGLDSRKLDLPKGLIHQAVQKPFDKNLTDSVRKVLQEIGTIKPGMTRKDLLRVMMTEGGLSTRLQRTYIHKACPFIKVDVEFKAVDKEQEILQEDPNDMILRISRPYLAWSIMD